MDRGQLTTEYQAFRLCYRPNFFGLILGLLVACSQPLRVIRKRYFFLNDDSGRRSYLKPLLCDHADSDSLCACLMCSICFPQLGLPQSVTSSFSSALLLIDSRNGPRRIFCDLHLQRASSFPVSYCYVLSAQLATSFSVLCTNVQEIEVFGRAQRKIDLIAWV
ncbi:hypothetical protein SISSUDRAFT_1050005 [Sistotremastrum suecicum HHB10207 ss-3]|uniref:Uncharacterized protein n=1 Tax=Sistotremastrum suecicum HHB10207 ss-3 TaxID=1314776 RepID=A0A166BFV1_9AGAM|nr:hypothetical protein SISSUDRAFT_1050005 [Sistotremastrum suecicum HHB10207 ss-3]